MIMKNVPTPTSLENVSVRLLQTVWSELLAFKDEYECVWIQETNPTLLNSYTTSIQPELQLLIITFTQSLELGLKSKICETSPYLLLSHFEQDSPKSNNDFLEFRTLGANRLPEIVDSLAYFELSNRLKDLYKKYNRIRNKVVHLGILKEPLSYSEIIEDLISCYLELYPRRNILADKMKFHTKDNHIIFENDSYVSPITTFFAEYQNALETINEIQFYKMYNVNIDQLNYICHHCTSSKDLEHYDFFKDDSPYSLKSSYKINDFKIYCILCDIEYEVYSLACGECDNGSIFSYYSEESKCHSCGYN